MKKLLFVFFLYYSCGILFAQTQKDTTGEFDNEKFLLIQKLLACQSIAHAILDEVDGKTKVIYAKLGSLNYSQANAIFAVLKVHDENMDERTEILILAVLEIMKGWFNNIEYWDSTPMPASIMITEFTVKVILKDLYKP